MSAAVSQNGQFVAPDSQVVAPDGEAVPLPDDVVFQPSALSDDDVFVHPHVGVRAALGAPTTLTSASGDDLAARFAVLHAGDVVASHDVNGRENFAHEAATGAAPRNRAELEQQVQQIVSGLDPRLLGDSLDVDGGAPVVGPDGVVEAGNARAVALQRAQRVPGQNASQYRDWLLSNAQAFGLDPAEVESIDKPMLVRVRSTPTDRAGVGRQLSVASLEPTLRGAADELASAKRDGREVRIDDADRLHPETVEALHFIAEHADTPDAIDELLKSAKEVMNGKPAEDAVRRDDRADPAPRDGAGGEPEATQGDSRGDQVDATAGSTEGLTAPEWMDFGPETGTLGVRREHMPQIRQQHRGPLTQFLLARGIAHGQEEVAPETLRPSQLQWSPGKVAASADRGDDDRAVLVSSDGHVVDGHHRWLSALANETPLRVIRFDAPALDLIDLLHQFPSAETATASAEKPA